MEFKFPDVGEGIHEGVIVSWLKEIGEEVEEDEPICEVETDKAVVEIPAPTKGKILKRYHEVGDTVNVGEVLVEFEVEGGVKKQESKPEKEEVKIETPEGDSGNVVGALQDADTAEKGDELDLTSSSQIDEEPSTKALPFVRKLAKELNVDIYSLSGTGKNGQITADDVKAAANLSSGPKQTSPDVKYSTPEYGDETIEDLKPIRKAIAANMQQSLNSTAQLTHFDEANIDKLIEFRSAAAAKISYLAYITEAIIQTLQEFPHLNASYDRLKQQLITKKYYNVGIAVDTKYGLVVPVIKNAEKLDRFLISNHIAELAEKARDRKLKPEEMKDSTFTITNYGSIGGKFATPILNYPNLLSIGIGKFDTKLVLRDGQPAETTILPLSITYDHQIIDGADAARFSNRLIEYLENPEQL